MRHALSLGCSVIDIRDLSNESKNRSFIGAVYNKGEIVNTTLNLGSYTDDETNHILTVTHIISGTNYTSEVPYNSYTVNNDNNTITIRSTYTVVTSGGVASHPSDEGFRCITNRMLYNLGIASTENTYTE